MLGVGGREPTNYFSYFAQQFVLYFVVCRGHMTACCRGLLWLTYLNMLSQLLFVHFTEKPLCKYFYCLNVTLISRNTLNMILYSCELSTMISVDDRETLFGKEFICCCSKWTSGNANRIWLLMMTITSSRANFKAECCFHQLIICCWSRGNSRCLISFDL